MQGWGYTGGLRQPNRFEEQYHCFSAAYADRGHLEVSHRQIRLDPMNAIKSPSRL